MKNNSLIYLLIAVFLGVLLGRNTFKGSTNSSKLKEQKIKYLINYIEQDYVDSVDTDDLLDDAIIAMLKKLDPHSVYIPKEDLQAITENMRGNFVGIGVQFKVVRDTIVVVQPIKGGSSIKKGIKAGDRILIANKDTLYGKKLKDKQIIKILKGQPNTQVNLKIYRKYNDSIFNVIVNRKKINIKSVDIAYMLNDSIGYIKLNRFARNTYTEFKNSLEVLLNKGMNTLVLDLRDNGGGYIDIADKIVDEFLEKDKLVVSTKNNKGTEYKLFATEKGSFENGKLYVLIDENSASASEIVAGALQDNDKGVIIGRRSFGKGLVQEEMSLGDGSAVRLTTARYYTPTGRCIQKPYGKDSLYYTDINKRYYSGELFNKDSIKIIDSLQYKTPKGKIVYGGGGIIPDVFVSLDYTKYIPTIFFKPLNNFAFNYVDKNREKLSLLTLDDFIKNFDNDNSVSNIFFKKIKGIKYSKKTKEQLKKYVKYTIARELFNDEDFYKFNHKDDKMIKKVFELQTKN